MSKRFVTPLSSHIIPFIDDRITQVQLELERGGRSSPGYDAALLEYRQTRDAFEQTHPELRCELDEVISAHCQMQNNLAREVYKQGAADCTALLRALFRRRASNDEESF